jgi:hypothetical protein
VIYLGGGTLDASPEVREFVSRTGIPVVSTLMGLGSFPSTDPLALQMLGMHGTVYANYSVDQVRRRRFCGRGAVWGDSRSTSLWMRCRLCFFQRFLRQFLLDNVAPIVLHVKCPEATSLLHPPSLIHTLAHARAHAHTHVCAHMFTHTHTYTHTHRLTS